MRFRTSLQSFDVVGGKEGAHLGDGDLVESNYGEFAEIKSRVEHGFSDAEELDSTSDFTRRLDEELTDSSRNKKSGLTDQPIDFILKRWEMYY